MVHIGKRMVASLLLVAIFVTIPVLPASANVLDQAKEAVFPVVETYRYFTGGETTIDRIQRNADKVRAADKADRSTWGRLKRDVGWAANVIANTPRIVFDALLMATFPCYGKNKPASCKR